MTDAEALSAAWDRAIGRYRGLDNRAAVFDTWLLESLRPRWEHRAFPGTSMYDLRFCTPGVLPHRAEEWVCVQLRDSRTVRGSLRRVVPRRGEARPTGPITVTGSVAARENTVPMVEALLYQLSPHSTPRRTTS